MPGRYSGSNTYSSVIFINDYDGYHTCSNWFNNTWIKGWLNYIYLFVEDTLNVGVPGVLVEVIRDVCDRDEITDELTDLTADPLINGVGDILTEGVTVVLYVAVPGVLVKLIIAVCDPDLITEGLTDTVVEKLSKGVGDILIEDDTDVVYVAVPGVNVRVEITVFVIDETTDEDAEVTNELL
jgi:hypothetical protein